MMKQISFFLLALPLSFFQLVQSPEGKAELADKEGQEVEVRGFLYAISSGGWILAQQPELPTCCRGASHRIGQQLTLQGTLPFESPQTAVTVMGKLQVHQDMDRTLYSLSDAQLKLSEDWNYKIIISLCLLILLLLIVIKRIRS